MAHHKDTHTSTRGFASMDEARQREIARKGGRSVPAERRSFSRNSELASWAGRKGGQSVPAQERTFSKDPGLAARAGRKGGQASGVARGRGHEGDTASHSLDQDKTRHPLPESSAHDEHNGSDIDRMEPRTGRDF